MVRIRKTSRRGSTSTSSGNSSCSSSETGSHTIMNSDSGMDLESIAEQVFEQLSQSGGSDGDAMDTRSMYSDATSTSVSGSLDVKKMVLTFMQKKGEKTDYFKLYSNMLDWIDPEIGIFISEEYPALEGRELDQLSEYSTLDIPSLAIIMFLKEEDSDEVGENGKFLNAREFFGNFPWKFHHSEWVSGSRIQAYSQNQNDYYFVRNDLPLCSVRQIHCGQEHVRVVRFITHENWDDSIRFYKLVLGQEPDAIKQDFCVFTTERFSSFDVQLSLKRLPKGINPKTGKYTILTFRIREVGALVPLLPNACHKISDVRWTTSDVDGNEIVLDIVSRTPSKSPQPTSLHSSQVSSPSICSPHSAFSPVLPSKHHQQVQNQLNNDNSLIDKLSPRVFTGNPLVGSTSHPSHVSSMSTDAIIAHQHSDSGFVDEKNEFSNCACEDCQHLAQYNNDIEETLQIVSQKLNVISSKVPDSLHSRKGKSLHRNTGQGFGRISKGTRYKNPKLGHNSRRLTPISRSDDDKTPTNAHESSTDSIPDDDYCDDSSIEGSKRAPNNRKSAFKKVDRRLSDNTNAHGQLGAKSNKSDVSIVSAFRRPHRNGYESDATSIFSEAAIDVPAPYKSKHKCRSRTDENKPRTDDIRSRSEESIGTTWRDYGYIDSDKTKQNTVLSNRNKRSDNRNICDKTEPKGESSFTSEVSSIDEESQNQTNETQLQNRSRTNLKPTPPSKPNLRSKSMDRIALTTPEPKVEKDDKPSISAPTSPIKTKTKTQGGRASPQKQPKEIDVTQVSAGLKRSKSPSIIKNMKQKISNALNRSKSPGSKTPECKSPVSASVTPTPENINELSKSPTNAQSPTNEQIVSEDKELSVQEIIQQIVKPLSANTPQDDVDCIQKPDQQSNKIPPYSGGSSKAPSRGLPSYDEVMRSRTPTPGPNAVRAQTPVNCKSPTPLQAPPPYSRNQASRTPATKLEPWLPSRRDSLNMALNRCSDGDTGPKASTRPYSYPSSQQTTESNQRLSGIHENVAGDLHNPTESGSNIAQNNPNSAALTAFNNNSHHGSKTTSNIGAKRRFEHSPIRQNVETNTPNQCDHSQTRSVNKSFQSNSVSTYSNNQNVINATYRPLNQVLQHPGEHYNKQTSEYLQDAPASSERNAVKNVHTNPPRNDSSDARTSTPQPGNATKSKPPPPPVPQKPKLLPKGGIVQNKIYANSSEASNRTVTPDQQSKALDQPTSTHVKQTTPTTSVTKFSESKNQSAETDSNDGVKSVRSIVSKFEKAPGAVEQTDSHSAPLSQLQALRQQMENSKWFSSDNKPDGDNDADVRQVEGQVSVENFNESPVSQPEQLKPKSTLEKNKQQLSQLFDPSRFSPSAAEEPLEGEPEEQPRPKFTKASSIIDGKPMSILPGGEKYVSKGLTETAHRRRRRVTFKARDEEFMFEKVDSETDEECPFHTSDDDDDNSSLDLVNNDGDGVRYSAPVVEYSMRDDTVSSVEYSTAQENSMQNDIDCKQNMHDSQHSEHDDYSGMCYSVQHGVSRPLTDSELSKYNSINQNTYHDEPVYNNTDVQYSKSYNSTYAPQYQNIHHSQMNVYDRHSSTNQYNAPPYSQSQSSAHTTNAQITSDDNSGDYGFYI